MIPHYQIATIHLGAHVLCFVANDATATLCQKNSCLVSIRIAGLPFVDGEVAIVKMHATGTDSRFQT